MNEPTENYFDQPQTLNGSKIKPVNIEWLWNNRIPKGMLSILEGDPGCGKTSITIDLAARLTTGQALPFSEALDPMGVLFINAEDGLNNVLIPRLEAAGANTALIECWNQQSLPPSVPQYCEWIKSKVIELNIGLIIIDPLVDFLGSGINNNSDQDVRKALTPLVSIARDTGTTILAVRHLNKTSGMSALQRGSGSIAFTALARSVMLASKHPYEDNVSVLAITKANFAPSNKSLSYSLVDGQTGPTIEWTGLVDITADDLVAEQTPPNAVEQASQFLTSVLADGPLTTELLHEKAEEQGISVASLRRAKNYVSVITKKIDGINHTYLSAQGAQPAQHPEVSTLSNLN